MTPEMEAGPACLVFFSVEGKFQMRCHFRHFDTNEMFISPIASFEMFFWYLITNEMFILVKSTNEMFNFLQITNEMLPILQLNK